MKACFKCFAVLLSLVFVFVSCTGNQYDMDIELINDYIASHHLDTCDIFVNENGLHRVVLRDGQGLSPSANDSVTFNFILKLTDDEVVNDEFSVKPCSEYLKNLVFGLQMGLTQMRPGERAVLLVPSNIGYGSFGFDAIKPNSVLVYDVSLVSFKSNL